MACTSWRARAAASCERELRLPGKKQALPGVATPPTPPRRAGLVIQRHGVGSRTVAGPSQGGARSGANGRVAKFFRSAARTARPLRAQRLGRKGRSRPRASRAVTEWPVPSLARGPFPGWARGGHGARGRERPFAHPNSHLQLLDGEGPGLLVHGHADLVVRGCDGGFHGGHGWLCGCGWVWVCGKKARRLFGVLRVRRGRRERAKQSRARKKKKTLAGAPPSTSPGQAGASRPEPHK